MIECNPVKLKPSYMVSLSLAEQVHILWFSPFILFQLKAHIESVHERKNICTFEDCGKIFKQKLSLREHRKSHFPEGNDPDDQGSDCGSPNADRSYVCTFRGKKYRTRNGFRAHEAMVHTRKLNHKCTHEGCNAAFFYYSELAIHTRSFGIFSRPMFDWVLWQRPSKRHMF